MTRHHSLTDQFSPQHGGSDSYSPSRTASDALAGIEPERSSPDAVADEIKPGNQSISSPRSDNDLPILSGQKLQQARQAQGLSLEQAAQSLYLSKSYVKAIEQDDYEQLPAGAFVVGYLRSYSKLLKLNSDEIVALYKESLPAEEAQLEPEDTFKLRSASVFRPVAATLSGLALLVVVSVAWTGDENRIDSFIDMVEVEDAHGNVVLENLASRASSAQDSREFSPLPLVLAADQFSNLPYDMVHPLGLDYPISGEVAFELYQDSPSVSDSLDNLESPVAFTQGSDNSVLNIEFSRECWIEVVDGNGEKIFADLKLPGSMLELSGVPPLRVKLGNWRAVSNIDFDAKSIAIPQPENRDVVQLALAPQDY